MLLAATAASGNAAGASHRASLSLRPDREDVQVGGRVALSGPTFRSHDDRAAARRPPPDPPLALLRRPRRPQRRAVRGLRAAAPRASARPQATLPWLSGPKVQTDVLACYREGKPDPWSRVYGIDPKCGQARLRFSDRVRGTAAR